MNNLEVNNFKLVSPKFNNESQHLNRNFGLTMSKPLSADTVSFKGTPKAANKAWEMNRGSARLVRASMVDSYKKAHKYIYNLFDDLLVTSKNPQNLLVDISGRLKSEDSIIAKSGTRKWTSIEEVKESMTDIVGLSLVYRDSNKAKNDAVINRFIPDIKSGKIELIEIENKRPAVVKGLEGREAGQYDYNTMECFKQLADIQDTCYKKGGSKQRVKRVLEDDFTDANYCATHYLFKIPGKKPVVFELQVTGDNVKKGKKVDDVLWKYLSGKSSADSTPEFEKLMEPFTNPEFFANEPNAEEIVENAKKNINKYRADVFLFQRTKPAMIYSGKKSPEIFLPIQYKIFPTSIELKYGISSQDYDFNNLAKVLQKKGGKTKS